MGRWLCSIDMEHQSSPRKPLHTGDMARRKRYHGLSTLQSACRVHHYWPVYSHPLFLVLSAELIPHSLRNSVSTTLALLVDLRIRRTSTCRGTYDPMRDEKTSFPAATSFHISSPDPYQNRRVSHEVSRPYKVQRPFEAGHFGYNAPSEQTTYDGGVGEDRL